MPRTEDCPARSALVLHTAAWRDGERCLPVSCLELERLLEGLGVCVLERISFAPPRSHKRIGRGKREEIRARLDALAERAPMIVVDTVLDPHVQGELARELGVEVVDRAGVVLRVFARRARTQLARAEVELARLSYALPRLREEAEGDDRGGGGGRGERGHTNLALAKQAMRARRAELEREIEKLRRARARQRARREGAPRVALVGYTNAGKSSLFRALTGSEVLVEDALFATLDATVRALSPETYPRVLAADTVGFIRDLPHALVASFRSTLDEARDADLCLIVLDASDDEHRAQLEVTRRTLEAIGVVAPLRLVLNKIDRVDPETLAALRAAFPDAIAVSALRREDVARLREAIVSHISAPREDGEVAAVPPLAAGDGGRDALAHLRSAGQ